VSWYNCDEQATLLRARRSTVLAKRAVENIKPVLFKRKKTPHENQFSCRPPLGENLLLCALAQKFFLIRAAFPGNAALEVLLATRRGRQWGLKHD
jgi:hypothetical protein